MQPSNDSLICFKRCLVNISKHVFGDNGWSARSWKTKVKRAYKKENRETDGKIVNCVGSCEDILYCH